MNNEKGLKYFSTFSGIGGFELGIERAHSRLVGERGQASSVSERQEAQLSAGADNKQASKQGRDRAERGAQAACVGFSEIDKYAAQIYQSHFPDHENYGDITAIDADALPDFDLFVGGFPCQAFSIAGKRAGFNDTRGTLFFDVARILKAKRPRNFLLENVKGLLSHDDGRTFKTIIATLAELGYCVEWQVLNSKDFGVPQNRERVFIVGHLGAEPARKVFPLERCVGTVAQDRSRKIWHENITGSLTPRDTATSLRQGASHNYQTVELIRRLTPVECERLQGFPDGWTEGVSDTQRYRQLGNAVTVNVIEAVVGNMLN